MTQKLHLRLGICGLTLWVFQSLSPGAARAAVPPTPAGAHPRLFLTPARLAALKARAAVNGSAVKAAVTACQRAMTTPGDFVDRGGVDGNTWPLAAARCALAYAVSENPAYVTQALKFWNASLNDDATLGDGKGCVAGVDTNWRGWVAGGSTPAPPVIASITHDSGYPARWFPPLIAFTYDWLHDAPGVDAALLSHTRTCLTNWIDFYTAQGYHRDEAGSNYNAGFVVGKTLTAIAFGGENGADGDRLWAETINDVFGKLLIGQGLAGAANPVGTAAGVMVGGDWGEGWQYGPLSVLEYAVAARAAEEAGAALPEMDAWANSLVVRYLHATVPRGDGVFNANGDLDSDVVYPSPNAGILDAVLVGPSSDQAAAWALSLRQSQMLNADFIWNALAEARDVAPQDYRTPSPAPPLWYLARGTRSVFARTSWDPSAFWAVFTSPPQVNSDHHHFAATNFVFSRGGDHLIVDPSNYGEPGTLETNAASADSPGVTGDYAPSQTPWSQAELVWARGTAAAVVAARGDFAKGFNNPNKVSDIPYAHREWVMLPEGEIVTIDRVQTASATRFLYVNFHANTKGTLRLDGALATGTVGSSQLAIHGVLLPGATATITQPPVKNDYTFPCGACSKGRFVVDNYGVKVAGPWAVAVHVIDGLAAGEAPAQVGSLNDDNFDPAPKQNMAVIGAAVYRASKQSYVVASAAQRGVAGATLSYGVPGASAGRHVVFDAPEQADGQSAVTAVAQADRCLLTISAGAGFTGHPLMFSVSTAADGCRVSEDTNVAPGAPPPGGGAPPTGTGGGGGQSGQGSSGRGGGNGGAGGSGINGAVVSGCSCTSAPDARGAQILIGAGALAVAGWVGRLRRRGVRPRR